MSNRARLSLVRLGGNRLLALAASLSALLTIMVGALLYIESGRYRREIFEEGVVRGDVLFSTLSHQLSDSLYLNNIEQIRKDSEFLLNQDIVQRIAVFSETGRYLFDSEQSKVPTGYVPKELLDLARSTDAALNRSGDSHLEFVGAIRFDGRMMSGLFFEMDLSEQLRAATVSFNKLSLTAVSLLLLVIGLTFALAQMLGARLSLRSTESNLHELIEQSPLPHSVFSVDGDLKYFNPAMHRLMGADPGTRPTVERRYNILEDRTLKAAGALERIRDGFALGPVEVPMFAYQRADRADPLFLEAVVFPLKSSNDRVSEVVVVLDDVTAEKLAEEERANLYEQMLQIQKLEGLGVMARGIAHDFNNLLTPVLGNADLLARHLPRDSPMARFARGIKKGARRASDLCTQLLAYGGGAQTKELADVSKEVRDMQELMKSSLSKKARFTMNLSDEPPPLVLIDRTQLQQVILNLIVNASEALEEEAGEVVLSTGVSELGARETRGLLPTPDLAPGQYVFLRVSDTGCGMDEATRRDLFNPFFTTKFTGRGLGMSTVLNIVGEHGGGVEVHSEPGLGTTFTVYLPLTAAAVSAPAEAAAFTLPMISKGTILLVDDEPTVLEIGRSALEALGFDVLIATDGREALVRFAQHEQEVCCVVMDFLMPVLNGAETLEQLRRRSPQLPVVVVTGLSTSQEVRAIADQPGVTVLRKPYDIDELEQAVAEVLDQELASTSRG